MIHPGELEVQRRAGIFEARGSLRLGDMIPPVAAHFLADQRMLVLAAADDRAAIWTGLVTGPAGFVTTPDDRTIRITARPSEADPLRDLVDAGNPVGALAIEPQTRRRIRINGRAETTAEAIMIHTDQVFGNCPKHIAARHVSAEVGAPPARRVTTGQELSEAQQQWVGSAEAFFIGTGADGHGLDVSHRGGNPGFVTVAGPRRLTWPEYAGNGMYLTLGNLHMNPSAGLLFLDWSTGAALHLTGRARIDWDPVRAGAVPGAQRLVEFDVDAVIEVRDASPLRWVLDEHHRFNPPVGRPPSSDDVTARG